MFGNVSAMVSKGIKSTEFPIKHLAKTFYFVFFHFKTKSKRFGGLNLNLLNFGLRQNPY